MSRSGSRYPSAFGHTPSYRSYSGTSVGSTYPSALGASSDISRDLLARDPLSTRDFGSLTSGFGTGFGNNDLLSGGTGSQSTSKVYNLYKYKFKKV